MRKEISKNLIERILGAAPKYSLLDLENKFPPRNLRDGAEVTRFAPSPTGYMHIGGLYQALVSWKIACQTGGVFFLRIEDTDTKREVKEAVDIIKNSLANFGLNPDEEYTQSQRRDIYHSVAADLMSRGLAYPCFMTAEDMERVRNDQKLNGLPTGIYGQFARDRDITDDEIAARLDAGQRPTIRLYSAGDPDRKIYCKDAARGSIAFPENNEDVVLIKSSDGLPTYHFAHIVDDHFMRTTLVTRGEEWLSSLPLHIEMFGVLGWTPPKYVHTSTLDKIDSETGKQRKLSKRKDPEANIATFAADGWPARSVLNYLFNIAASGFEEELAKKPGLGIENFDLKIKKIPQSGALFDWKKLEWWAKEYIAGLSADDLTNQVINWASEFDADWAARINGDENYLKEILNIERGKRKDFITYKQTLESIAFFFDDLFVSKIADKNIISEFLSVYNPNDSKDEWWAKIQNIATKLGVKNGEVAMCLRVALTGREQTPDLYSMISVMGETKVKQRLNNEKN